MGPGGTGMRDEIIFFTIHINGLHSHIGSFHQPLDSIGTFMYTKVTKCRYDVAGNCNVCTQMDLGDNKCRV